MPKNEDDHPEHNVFVWNYIEASLSFVFFPVIRKPPKCHFLEGSDALLFCIYFKPAY